MLKRCVRLILRKWGVKTFRLPLNRRKCPITGKNACFRVLALLFNLESWFWYQILCFLVRRIRKTYFKHNWMVIEGLNSNLRVKITSSDSYFRVISALSCPNHAEMNILSSLWNCLTCYWSHWCAQIIWGTYIRDTGHEKVLSNPKVTKTPQRGWKCIIVCFFHF